MMTAINHHLTEILNGWRTREMTPERAIYHLGKLMIESGMAPLQVATILEELGTQAKEAIDGIVIDLIDQVVEHDIKSFGIETRIHPKFTGGSINEDRSEYSSAQIGETKKKIWESDAFSMESGQSLNFNPRGSVKSNAQSISTARHDFSGCRYDAKRIVRDSGSITFEPIGSVPPVKAVPPVLPSLEERLEQARRGTFKADTGGGKLPYSSPQESSFDYRWRPEYGPWY